MVGDGSANGGEGAASPPQGHSSPPRTTSFQHDGAGGAAQDSGGRKADKRSTKREQKVRFVRPSRSESNLSEIELFPMTSRLPTFDVAPESQSKFLPRLARRGSSLRQGPHMALSCTYLVSVHGLEYMQLYLWLAKDWCWSQLHWVYPGIIFGTLAVLWSIMLFFLAASARLYSEAFLGLGMVFWVSANYVWMVGEFWESNFLEDGEEFYADCLQLARVFSAGAVFIVTVYFAVLMPLGVFAYERRTNPLMARLCDDAPPPRFRYIFSTFREYENLHLLFWAIKDMCWVYDWPHGYMFGFGPTLLLGMDLMYLFATYRDQFIDFVHAVVMFLWVLSNGVWAYGELIAENPRDIPDEAWDAYNFPEVPEQFYFWPRYATSWFFMAAAAVVVAFYVYWVILSIKCPPVEEDDTEEGDFDTQSIEATVKPTADDWEHQGGADRMVRV